MQAYTDPTRIRKTDPGHPEGCVVFAYHQKFSPETSEQVACDCRAGSLGCVEHKRQMAQTISEFLEPIHARRRHYETHQDEVRAIIEAGDKRARQVAEATMEDVRKAICLG